MRVEEGSGIGFREVGHILTPLSSRLAYSRLACSDLHQHSWEWLGQSLGKGTYVPLLQVEPQLAS